MIIYQLLVLALYMTVLYYPTSLCMTTLYQLLVVADYSVYDSPLLPESVYDYPLPIISSG